MWVAYLVHTLTLQKNMKRVEKIRRIRGIKKYFITVKSQDLVRYNFS